MFEKQIKDIEQFYSELPAERVDAVQPTREQFTRLLAELAEARRVPGISKRLIAEEDYQCSEDEALQTKKFLERMFKINSKDSLIEFKKRQFKISVHYEQFMTFWKEAPLFDINELNDSGRTGFETLKNCANEFYPLLAERGFYAWDISEYIAICRIARGCGIINAEEFDEITDRYVRKAQVFYHSFKEYALSCLCGALYFMVEDRLEGIEQFYDIQKRIISNLFVEDAPWQYYAWYKPEKPEIVQIYPGNPACVISKAAIESGIGYMYREESRFDQADSGWRFFKGDETDEYANNYDNIQVMSLNEVCNARPDILAYLEAPNGSSYGWTGKDWNKEY